MCFLLDDEKNKMLPEAESINKDGSQEGLVEAANIPLQSKEEDQMWKILKMDERWTNYSQLVYKNYQIFLIEEIVNFYYIVTKIPFFSVQFLACVTEVI